MFALNLRIVTENGEQQVPVKPKNIIAFEREFQTGLGRAFATDQKVEHIYWLAWKSSGSAQNFDSWLDTVVDVQVVEDTELPLSETP